MTTEQECCYLRNITSKVFLFTLDLTTETEDESVLPAEPVLLDVFY